MIIVGNTVLQGQEGTAIHQIVADMSLKLKKSKKVEKDWKVLNVLHRVCNTTCVCCVQIVCRFVFCCLVRVLLQQIFYLFSYHC